MPVRLHESAKDRTTQSELPTVLTEAAVAELLGVPIRTLRRLCQSGKGPKRVKVGGVRVVSRDDLLSWLTQRAR
jgi:excisionase family DNA binding protein